MTGPLGYRCPGKSGKIPRIKFNEERDLALLRQCIGCHAYSLPNGRGWKQVASALVKTYLFPSHLTARACRDRSNHLLAVFKQRDQANGFSSGTEEAFGEKEQLLEKLLNLRMEAEGGGAEATNVPNDRDAGAASPEQAPSTETNGLLYESVAYGCKQGKERRPPQITDGSRPNQSTIEIGSDAKLCIIMSKEEGRPCLKITQGNLHHNRRIGPEIDGNNQENRRADIDSPVGTTVELPSCDNNDIHKDTECEIEIKTEIDDDEDPWADQVSVDSAPCPSSSYDKASSQTSTLSLKNGNSTTSNVAKKRKQEKDDDETVQLSKENVPNLVPQEDEHDTFGKMVAFKLRTLSIEQRLHAEKLVSEVLYEASFGSLSRNTRLTDLINTNNEHRSCSSSSTQRNCDNVRSTVDAQT